MIELLELIDLIEDKRHKLETELRMQDMTEGLRTGKTAIEDIFPASLSVAPYMENPMTFEVHVEVHNMLSEHIYCRVKMSGANIVFNQNLYLIALPANGYVGITRDIRLNNREDGLLMVNLGWGPFSYTLKQRLICKGTTA